MSKLTFSASLLFVGTYGHGFTIIPPPRNSVDKDQPLFAGGKFPNTNGKAGCTESTGACGCWCSNGTSTCDSAQSCFWFSQGCSIGCPTCISFPDHSEARTQKDLCNSGMNATICDSRMRTYNMNATCNGKDDLYRHNPWRAPGKAPVWDPCGRAGGGVPDGKVGGGAAFFTDTVHAKGGDLGSEVLPEMPSGTVWKAGAEVEATWGMRANHGGGYQYRLCPKSFKLTEECFKSGPLPFVGKQSLQYQNGSRQLINSSYTFANGTGWHTEDGHDMSFLASAAGTWVRNPIPDHWQKTGVEPTNGLEFDPPCADDTSAPTLGLCSGERPFHLAIIDVLKIPEDTPTGDYILGFRWDCEETAQIWASCSDITITAA